MTCTLYLPKIRRSFDDKLQRSIAKCCTQAERWLRIFNAERTFSLSLKMAPLSLGKKKSKTGRRPWAPGRKIYRPPARPGMYFNATPTHPLGVCHKKAGWAPARPCRRSCKACRGLAKRSARKCKCECAYVKNVASPSISIRLFGTYTPSRQTK